MGESEITVFLKPYLDPKQTYLFKDVYNENHNNRELLKNEGFVGSR